jgi:hypothetical protein
MMRNFVMPMLIILALWPSQLWAQATAAEEDMKIFIEKVHADKKLVVAAKMELTDAEAQGFWPIYEAYQGDLKGVNQRLLNALFNYADAYKQGSITDAQATLMISEAVAMERFEADMLESYGARLAGVLPPWKIVRYLQIERKIRAAIRYSAAKEVPLAK